MNSEYIIIVIAIMAMIIFAIRYELILQKAKNIEDRTSLNYYQIEGMPSTFVTIGLLGTCLGIAIGLFNFNTDAGMIKQSVKELLSGLKLAFIITVLGLIFSLFFKTRVNKVLNLYGDIQPPESPELRASLETNNLLKEIGSGIINLNRAFSEELISKIQDSNKELAKNLSLFGANLASSNHDALIEALEDVINDLNSSFKETLGTLVKQNFSELTNSIANLNHWQIENKKFVEDFETRHEKVVKLTEDMDSSLAKIVMTNATLLEQDSKLYDIVDALNSVMVQDKNFKEITKNLNDASSNIKLSIGQLKDDLVDTKNHLAAITDLRANIELLINKLGQLKNIDIDEERLYISGIKQTMSSLDEMFKKHYEVIPKLVQQCIKDTTNGAN